MIAAAIFDLNGTLIDDMAAHGRAWASVFRELGLMVQAGLTPLQVLRAATVNGARAMGLERELGTLAPGKLADLLILDADPLADVQNLARIHRVIKDGQLFAPEELMRSLSGT